MSDGLFTALASYVSVLDDNGNDVGSFGPVNISVLQFTDPEPEKIERISYSRDTYGQALNTANIPKPNTISFTFDDADAEHISLALRGQSSTFTQAAGTNAATVVHVYHDKWVDTGKRGLTAVTIAGSVEDTDFVVDYESGMIKALSTGNLTDDNDETFALTYPAYSGTTVTPAVVTSTRISLNCIGKNLYKPSQKVRIKVFDATVSANEAVDATGATPTKFTFTGTMATPSGQSGPYKIERYEA